MSAEGMPRDEPSFLARPLAFSTRLVVRFPVPIVVGAVVAAVLAMLLTATRLGFRTSRLDLLNPESSYNQLWIEYINEFGEEDDAVVVVEGPRRQEVVPVLTEISRRLGREDRLFHAVLHEVDLSKIRSKGLYYLPLNELHSVERFLGEIEPVVQGDWARLNLGNMVASLSARMAAASGEPGLADRLAAERELGQLAEGLLGALTDRGCYRSPWPQMPQSITTLSELDSEYLLTREGRLGFVLLRIAQGEKDSFAQGSEAIDALRDLIDQVGRKHPEVRIGLTGLPVMENDEMRTSQSAMMRASLLSLFGVACLFIAGFGGLRHPLMTVGALLMAMAWSFGYITLAVGHLNILSIAFGVILIGLGIDFGVHYVARYLQNRTCRQSPAQALERTAVGVGPGIITGAVTTAIAFFTAGLTEFTGIAELGIIAGGGILLCCFAAMIVLPAMIYLSDVRRLHEPLPAPLDLYGWLRPLMARPGLTFCLTAALTGCVTLGVARLWYDHNLLNLQPVGLESVELERRLLAESDQSVWYALSMASSREDLLKRKARFLEQPSIERVEEIASLFPSDHQAKRPVIARIRQRLADLPEQSPAIPIDSPAELGVLLARAQQLLDGGPPVQRIQRQLEEVRDALRRMPPAERYARLSDFQHGMAGDLLSRLHTLRGMANPEPPKLEDLPEGLVTRFVGQSNKFLLKIYAKGSIWDMEAMERFVREVRSVDPRATGNPLQTYEASRQMKRSYEQAAVYSLIAILIALYLDFRSIRYTLLAMVPLALGMLQTFGMMGYLDIPLNPANMIVLPLLMGIGIDDGVHIVHDFRRQPGKYRISASTASSVLITSLTTMVGFGSLMIASHRGLQSLGRVLTIGVSCCLFTSLVMLPSALVWLRRHALDPASSAEPSEAPTPSGGLAARRRDVGSHPGTSPHAFGAPGPQAARRETAGPGAPSREV